MEEDFKVYILKFRINNIDRYLADLEGTLSLSKSDSVIFNSREKAYQYSGKLENFYESAGLIATVIDEEIGINEWKILNNYQASKKGWKMKDIKKTSNDNQTSVRVTGICPSCKKTNTGIATDGDIPKYCRLCGSRMNYSFSSNPSSKNVEG